MSTLQEIQAQIAELNRQADEIKNREKGNVIAEMREKIDLYGITARDLRLDLPSVPVQEGRRSRGGRETAEPKYRDDQGNTWSGGRGRKPQWVKDILDAGGDMKDYRIKD